MLGKGSYHNQDQLTNMYFRLVCLCLSVLLSSCGGGGGESGNGRGYSGFAVPGSVTDDALRDCLESLAIENGWRGASDVRSIVCYQDHSGGGVASLEGVQEFPNLEEIIVEGSANLSRGRISDLSPLRGLGRLRTIELYESDLRSLESMRDMTSLQRLVIIPTRFSDLSPITTLVNLRHLDLSVTSLHAPPIYDFSPLGRLSGLEELYLEAQLELRNTGLGFLSGMRSLRLLNIASNSLDDASGIQHLPNLEHLVLSYNRFFGAFDDTAIETLLSSLVNLRQFWYEGFDGHSLGFLQGMPNLEVLGITRYYGLSSDDLTVIGALNNLRELYLGGFARGDVSLLQGLSGLEVLWIADSTIESETLAFPATLSSLRELHLLNAFSYTYDYGDSRGDFKNSYSVFQDLPSLTDLHLFKPWLLDEAAVTLNRNVNALSMVAARLDSIEFLTDVGRVRHLDLSQNPFVELDTLATMPDLESLVLNDTAVSCDELVAFQATKPGVQVTTNLYCP